MHSATRTSFVGASIDDRLTRTTRVPPFPAFNLPRPCRCGRLPPLNPTDTTSRDQTHLCVWDVEASRHRMSTFTLQPVRSFSTGCRTAALPYSGAQWTSSSSCSRASAAPMASQSAYAAEQSMGRDCCWSIVRCKHLCMRLLSRIKHTAPCNYNTRDVRTQTQVASRPAAAAAAAVPFARRHSLCRTDRGTRRHLFSAVYSDFQSEPHLRILIDRTDDKILAVSSSSAWRCSISESAAHVSPL